MSSLTNVSSQNIDRVLYLPSQLPSIVVIDQRVEPLRDNFLTPPSAIRGSFSSGKVSDHSSPSPSPDFSDAEELASVSNPVTPTSASGNRQATSPRQLLITFHVRALIASNDSLPLSGRNRAQSPLPDPLLAKF